MSDLLFEKEGRYLSLRGPYINQLGSIVDHSIAPDFIENRVLRDGEGNGHHITVINHLEIGGKVTSTILDDDGNKRAVTGKEKKKLFKSAQLELVASIIAQFGDVSEWEKPIDLGLGSINLGDAKTYYRVIYWPFGQNIRHFVGLNNSNFHITVGFSPRDVHQYKGPGTLLCLQKDQPCTKELYSRLIGYIPFYFWDKDFIQALLLTGWRHGYYMQLASISKILLKCEI